MEENKNEQNLSDSTDNSSQVSQETELESNAARRLRLLGVENDSKIHDKELEIKKGNFWSNLWYKRKWLIIISAFFIVMGIILAAMLLFKNEKDISVGYIGPYSNQSVYIKDVFEPYISDQDGDGKKELELNASEYHDYSNDDNVSESVKQANDNIAGSFYESIRYNNFDIVFIDKSLYDEYSPWFYTIDELIEMGANIDKEEHASLFKDSTGKVYSSAIILQHTKLATDNKAELGKIYSGDTVLICICRKNAINGENDSRIKFLNNILEYEDSK